MANSEQLIASASTALMGSLFDEIAIRRFVSSLVFISVSLPMFCSFFYGFFFIGVRWLYGTIRFVHL